MTVPANLFSEIPARIEEEQFVEIVRDKQVRIERIVSQGHASPPGFWYDQPRHEWVTLLQGTATIEFEDGEVDLIAGDHLTIPAHRRHRVKSTDAKTPTIWIAVHYGGSEG